MVTILCLYGALCPIGSHLSADGVTYRNPCLKKSNLFCERKSTRRTHDRQCAQSIMLSGVWKSNLAMTSALIAEASYSQMHQISYRNKLTIPLSPHPTPNTSPAHTNPWHLNLGANLEQHPGGQQLGGSTGTAFLNNWVPLDPFWPNL